MQNTLATVFQFKRHLGIPTNTTHDDDRLLTVLAAAYAHITHETGRHYIPYVAAIPHDVVPLLPNELILADDLLELTALRDASGEIDPAQVTIHPMQPDPGSVLYHPTGRFVWDNNPKRAVTVTGVWGWHNTPHAMWLATGDSVQVAIDAAATAVSVGDASAPYADGVTPRFCVGMVLRVGDEFLRVAAVDTTANLITVERGVQGTTAVPHDAGTALAVYRPPYSVLITVMQLAAWYYREPDRAALAEIPNQVVWTLLGLRRITVAG